jgi:hypothetical protein
MSPSSRISQLEEQLRSAEERAGKAEADLTKVVGMWTQLKVYLDAMDVRSKDARIGFDRIVEGVSLPGMNNGIGELVDVEQVSPIHHHAPVVPVAGPPPAPKEANAAAALLPPRKRRRKVTPQGDATASVVPLPPPPPPTTVVVVTPNGNTMHPHSPHSSSSTVSLDVDEMLLNATTSHQDLKKRKRRASSISSSFSGMYEHQICLTKLTPVSV